MGDSGDVGVVRVLGSVQFVAISGDVVDLPSAIQRRLLAVLALHSRQALRTEWLADTLDLSPGALRTAVSRLRRLVGDTTLVTTSVGYRLDAAVDADLFTDDVASAGAATDRIEALEGALARWAGPALEEFAGEEWAAGDAVRLNELRAAAIEDLAAALIAARRWSDAVAALEAHVALHPLRDRPRGLLMEALAGEGRQADALRAFQQYRTLLADEIGTEPSVEVQRIEQRIASSWDALDIAVPLHAVFAQGPPLAGRSDEWASLDDDVAQARDGGLQPVVLIGEAGIGKSSLLAAFGRALAERHDATVLYGRCDDGAAVPLQPFRSIVGWCVEHVPASLLERHVARCGGVLQRVSPELLSRVSVPEPVSSDDATERFLLFEAVADLFRRVAADRVLVVVLDDLHWAEPTALSLLRHLTRALADAPVVLIASLRDTGQSASEELRLAMADLDRAGARRLTLTGLNDADLSDLAAFVTNSTVDETVVARLRHDSAGNPLYATQLLRHWVESGSAPTDGEIPPNLRDIVWSRVGSLGSTAAAVLSAGAVLGVEFSEDVLAELVDLDEARVDGALDAAVDAGLLVPAEPTLRSMRFVHALVANWLYSELRPLQRRRLHERAARALQKSVDAIPQSVVVQLARHCALGGLTREAIGWATAAGDYAFEHLAPSEAATWFGVALEHADALGRPDAERADLIVRRGEALLHGGDPTAFATLRAGADLAEECGAPGILIRAALATDRGYLRLGQSAPEQLAIVEAAVTVADPADTRTYARLLALFSQSLINTARDKTREMVGRQALELATASTDPTLLPRVASAVLYGLWGPGTSSLRADVAARAIAAAEASGDPVLQFTTHTAAYNVAVLLADPAAAAHSLGRLRTIASEVGDPRMRWTVAINETFEATMAARLDDAERLANETFELGTQIGEPDAFTIYAGQFFVIGTFAGRHADLFPIVEEAATDAPALHPLRLSYGIICAAVGRHDTAREVLAEGADAGFSNIPADMFWMTSVIGYAVIAIELGDDAAAAQLFPIIEPFAAEVAYSGATSQGPISAYVGKLASLLGHHDVADSHLRDALRTAEAFGWEYHRATTLIALAQSRLRRHGSFDAEAQTWLAEAEVICADRGLMGWALEIENLRAKGESGESGGSTR